MKRHRSTYFAHYSCFGLVQASRVEEKEQEKNEVEEHQKDAEGLGCTVDQRLDCN